MLKKEWIIKELTGSAEVNQSVSDQFVDINSSTPQMKIGAPKAGRKSLMGIDGSTASAKDLPTELLSRFTLERRALPAIAATTDIPAPTAASYDYGYERVLSRQIEALAESGTSRGHYTEKDAEIFDHSIRDDPAKASIECAFTTDDT
jgi:D-sedoheptulose 7-phosphate isomerase